MIRICKDPRIVMKVWDYKISQSGKSAEVRATTSEKNSEGKYIDSTWFIRICGEAFRKLGELKKGDRIEVKEAKLSNTSYRTDDGRFRNSFGFLVFDADLFTGNLNNPREDTQAPVENKRRSRIEEDYDDDQPW